MVYVVLLANTEVLQTWFAYRIVPLASFFVILALLMLTAGESLTAVSYSTPAAELKTNPLGTKFCALGSINAAGQPPPIG
jgi:hypothetical protein